MGEKVRRGAAGASEAGGGLMPREFIYAGAIVLWVILSTASLAVFATIFTGGNEQRRDDGCGVWGISMILWFVAVYFLAVGAIKMWAS